MAKIERQNKASEKGMAKTRGQVQTVHEAEHYSYAGSPGGKGVSFTLPKDVTDHSKIRTPEHK